MEKYNYLENIKGDVLEYIKDNYTIEEIQNLTNGELYDTLFIEDSVTGNASGSYYCNSWKAEESLAHNLDLLQEACDMFGITLNLDNAEAMDVTIRCYLLGQAIDEALEGKWLQGGSY